MRINVNLREIMTWAAAIASGLLLAYVVGVSVLALRWLLTALILSAVAAASAEPLVRILETRMSRKLAVRTTMLAGFGILVLVGWVLIPALVRSLSGVLASAPELIAEAARLGSNIGLDPIAITSQATEWVGAITDLIRNNSGSLVVSASGALGTTGLVLFVSYYLVMEGPEIRQWVARHLSRVSGVRFLKVWDLAMEKVGTFMVAYVVLAAIAGVVVTTTAIALRLPFPVGLGAWATLASLVPLFGGTLAAVLPVLVTITADLGSGRWTSTIWMVAILVAFQALDNYVLRPKIMGRMMRLHPVVVVLSILIGGALLGVLGAIVAVPVAAVLQGLFSEWEALRNPTPNATSH